MFSLNYHFFGGKQHIIKFMIITIYNCLLPMLQHKFRCQIHLFLHTLTEWSPGLGLLEPISNAHGEASSRQGATQQDRPSRHVRRAHGHSPLAMNSKVPTQRNSMVPHWKSLLSSFVIYFPFHKRENILKSYKTNGQTEPPPTPRELTWHWVYNPLTSASPSTPITPHIPAGRTQWFDAIRFSVSSSRFSLLGPSSFSWKMWSATVHALKSMG